MGYNIVHWSVGEERQLREMTGHSDLIETLAFNSETGILASGGADCEVRLWDSESAVSTARLTGHTSDIFELAWHPRNASILASCDLSFEVRVWDTAISKLVHSPSYGSSQNYLFKLGVNVKPYDCEIVLPGKAQFGTWCRHHF